MNRVVKILILILFIGLTYRVAGQQSPMYTQYMFNKFIYNPAVAGTYNYYQIRSNHRFQWIGMPDAPLTNTLSFYGPHAKLPMGYGGYLYYDVTGPTSKAGLTGSYAYNISVTDDIRVSMGVSFGIMQFKVDGTQINLKDKSDLALQGTVNSIVPDANFGVYMYASNFYAGFSTSQLINTKLRFYEQATSLNKLKSHFYFTGGYIWEINNQFTVEPSAMLKGTAPKQIQVDFNTRVIYLDMVWAGLSYRSKDALSFLVGYTYDNKIYFGYSYDFTVTELRKYNSGTHEIMIGYRFNDIKR
jgi:type IX secretion system PorP/SprF family membrane protein